MTREHWRPRTATHEDITGSAATSLAPYLDSGEVLRWSGRPRQGFVLRGSDWFLIPFSLLWGGFAVFWEIMAIAGGPGFFMVWGIPFVVIGVYMIAGRFFADRLIRSRTVYGITDSRAIILSGFSGKQVKSLSLRTLTDVSLSESRNRSGTITFGAVPPGAAFMQGFPMPGAANGMPAQFELIDDARAVYDVIRDAQAAPTNVSSQ